MEDQEQITYSLLGVELPFEEFDRLLCEQAQGKELKVFDGKVVAEARVVTQEEMLEQLRNRRVAILDAFDKWEKAVLRGRESDDAGVMAWYKNLLDLDESAFADIPERIRYYM